MKIDFIKYFRNFFVTSTLLVLVWMTFFDANDFITQIKNSMQLQKMIGEKKYYLKEIERVKKEKKELSGNDKLLEKFAREKYLMKKPGEEVFVIVPKEEEDARQKNKLK